MTLRREPFEEIVHVLIADSGMGIAADRLDEVFEPFVTSKAHGVGLGLAISRTIMADHGGDLRAESGDGGAVLHLTLPVMSKVRAPHGVLPTSRVTAWCGPSLPVGRSPMPALLRRRARYRSAGRRASTRPT